MRGYCTNVTGVMSLTPYTSALYDLWA